MELKNISGRITAFLQKYKYVALVLLIGAAMMLLPTKSSRDATPDTTVKVPEKSNTINQELSEILSQIEGAGTVKVMVTTAAGEETVYQQDSETSTAEGNSSVSISTVIIASEDKSENGLVKQVNPPVYLGVIVVCQGADQPAVKLAIIDAVSKITGIGSNRISVLKMK